MKNMLGRKVSLTYLVALGGLGLLLAGAAEAQQAPSTQADPGKPATAGEPKNNVRPAIKWKRSDYTCEGGTKVAVYVHDTVAKVRTGDRNYVMMQARSADGNRYSDGKILWWSNGDTGFLQEDTPDGDGKMLVKGCVLDKPADAAKP